MLLALLTLTLPASASGIMERPVHHRVSDACAVQTGPQDSEQPLLYQGYQLGYTSPPGGPVTTHVFIAQAHQVSLHRAACEQPELGDFETTHMICGPTEVLQYTGELLPGTAYTIRGDVGDLLRFTTAGETVARACPVAG